MKVLIVVSCLLAVASAGIFHTPYTYPAVVHAQHIPVIGADGVPADEPAVVAARAHHAAAHIEAKARNGDVAVVAPVAHVAAPVAYSAAHVAAPLAYSAAHVAAPLAYSAAHVAAPVAYAAPVAVSHYAGPQHLPVIGPNGVPVDEPAVAVARAQHVAHHVEAKVRNGDAAVVAPFAYAGHHIASVAHSVVPAETPEVAAARAAHYAAHVEAKVLNGVLPVVHYRKRRGIFGAAHVAAYSAPAHVAAYSAPVAHVAHVAAPVVHHYAGPQHLPVIGADGVPADEPAVVAARAHHAAAHIEAKARNGDVAVVGAHVAAPFAYSAAHVAAPVAYAAPVAVSHYAGPQHLPVIGFNGVPVDEPAVVAARAQHVAHHVEAKVRNGDAAVVAPVALAHHVAPLSYLGAHHVPVIGADGVPADEPAVVAARAHHVAAHIEAKVRNGDLHVVSPLVHY